MQTNQPSKDIGFGAGVKQDIMQRSENVANISDELARKKLTLPEGTLQTVGQAAGGMFDIAGRAISAVTPNFIEKPIIKAISSVAQTAPIQKVIKTYEGFKEKHPRAAADLEAGLNILMALGLPKASEVSGEITKGVGTVLEKGGISALDAEKQSFARRLVRPIETKAVKEAEVARTTETGIGPFKRSVIEPTPAEAKAQNAVLNIPEISAKKTYQQNYNVIKKYNTNLAIKLESDLAANDFIYTKKELISRLNATKTDLENSPALVGDGVKIADKLIAEVKRRVDIAGAKGSSLLQVRKDFDNWVTSQKPKVFDAKAESAFTIANRDIRNTINGFLNEKAPSVGVKDSLSKQNALYNALDNIQPKAALEANTAVGRAFQNMMNAVGIKNKLVQQIAALVGIGGLGAAATFAPAAAGIGIGGYVIYQGGKFILNPKLRVYLGQLLQEYGKIAGPVAETVMKKSIDDTLNPSE